MATAQFFVDYQNLHLTAWETFESFHMPVHSALIHPARFADRVGACWLDDHREPMQMTAVHVFRGLPDPRKEPRQNSRVSRQHAAWRKDPRVTVRTRALRYPRDWPDEKAQEKGIDVLLALSIVQAAITGASDYYVLVSRDTDLLPAVEFGYAARPGSIAIATWAGSSVLRPSVPVRTVQLGKQDYLRSRDITDYR